MTDATAPPPTRQPYSAEDFERAERCAPRGLQRYTLPTLDERPLVVEFDFPAMFKQAASQARVLAGLRQSITEWIEGRQQLEGQLKSLHMESSAELIRCEMHGLKLVLAEWDRLVAREGQQE